MFTVDIVRNINFIIKTNNKIYYFKIKNFLNNIIIIYIK